MGETEGVAPGMPVRMRGSDDDADALNVILEAAPIELEDAPGRLERALYARVA